MERNYYLLDRGYPYFCVLTSVEARALYDAAPVKTGSMDSGFEYTVLLENGAGQRIAMVTRVSPISAADLPAVAAQVARFSRLPHELAEAA